jgi:hypothetical protein
VRFVTITLCVASQLAIRKVRVYFVIDSVRKLLDIDLQIHIVEQSTISVVCFTVLSNIVTPAAQLVIKSNIIRTNKQFLK